MSNTETESKKTEGGDTSSHVFGNALQTWVEIDLPSLQKKLDEQGIELKEDQKASLLSRKNLASKTKEFKKLEDSEKLNQFKSLLKLYQNEIDNLTNKNKMVENYFFGIYRSLAEAPDPQSNWLEKENNLKDQIKIAQRQIEELRTSNEVTELKLDNQNKQTGRDGVSASTLAELEIVTRDAEASKKRVFELEKRNEDLRSANLNQTRKKLHDSDKEHASKTDSLNRDISSMELEIKNLKAQLDKASDYEEIKSELQLLRQIEFGHGDDDDEDETGNANAKVDSILIERNKSLTQQLADHRAQHDDLNSKIVSLEAQVESSLAEVNRLRELNEKLENDLTNLQDVTSNNRFNDNASLISGMTRMTRPNGRNGSIISGQPGNNFGSGLGIVAEDSPSILPIITKQRDRFREKNNELEEELRKQLNLVNELKRQNNSLKKDNEELYERTRYLASFQTPGTRNITTTSSGRKFLNPRPNTDIESNPYQQSYESKLHPIEQFRMREQERINSRLSPLERLFISITRAVLATRTTRMLFLAYCLGLHIVVMFVTIYAMNLSTALIPEVGKNTSTGGIASNKVISDVSSGKVANPL
ncbi:CASP C terminal family protein [Candida albicans]|uniref:Protein CASP n=1 Tax=Candida albicans TaxID=5476 RepID=A0A8H6F2G7_CANAX|nr:CASP C terminal family protein [Candida albicans]